MATKVDYYETGADSTETARGDYYLAMTFTASKSYTIVSCEVLIYRTGSPGTSYVQLWAVNSGTDVPSGGDITNGSFNGTSLTTDTGGEWQSVTFNDSQALTMGTQYALILLAPSGNSSNLINWKGDSTSGGYAGGDLCTSSNGGFSWAGPITDYDMYFRTYEAESGPANVKTIDGLAKASVKAVDGLAIGSVKSINGLT